MITISKSQRTIVGNSLAALSVAIGFFTRSLEWTAVILSFLLAVHVTTEIIFFKNLPNDTAKKDFLIVALSRFSVLVIFAFIGMYLYLR